MWRTSAGSIISEQCIQQGSLPRKMIVVKFVGLKFSRIEATFSGAMQKIFVLAYAVRSEKNLFSIV